MIHKIAVWGDSVLKGVVLDSVSGRYTHLGERGCVPGVSKALSLPIENHSKFGLTSEKGLTLFEKNIADGLEADVVVICLGGNDVDHPWREIAEDPEGEHGPQIPLARFCDNITRMVRDAKGKGAVPLLVTPPPIDAERYFAWFSKGITHSENILKWLGGTGCIYRMQELYGEAVIKLASKLGCRLIDIRQAFLQLHDFTNYLCLDGIHPNENGHRLMERVFIEYAKENLMNGEAI